MADKKVWFIAGAGRGMGVDITKSALAAGNARGLIDMPTWTPKN